MSVQNCLFKLMMDWYWLLIDWSENHDFDETLPIASPFIGRVSVGPLGLPVTETESAGLGDYTAAWLSTYYIDQLVVIQESSR